MSTYYGTYGQKVQYLASDPTDVQIGQVWYNSTSATLKVRSLQAGAFSSGGNVNTARYIFGSAGTQTAALAFGGQAGAIPPVANSESYNGSAWTNTPSLNTARLYVAGLGTTNTAAVAFGGSPSATENWNGSSWASGNALNNPRSQLAGTGSQTAGLAFGSPNYTESYNGTNWTSLGTMNTGRANLSGSGNQTGSIAAGGNTPAPAVEAAVESWNGTSWTTIPSLNTARYAASTGGTSNTASAVFGGTNGPVVFTSAEEYNGVSWSTSPATMNTGRYWGGAGNVGTQSSSLFIAGQTAPSFSALTEEWNGPTAVTKTVTVS